ncbi:hypothetical protein J6590_077502 [Homalodisca vitripennis]|nr:hypothetical protein J6590_077502 [Homalodisca vitripennis]
MEDSIATNGDNKCRPVPWLCQNIFKLMAQCTSVVPETSKYERYEVATYDKQVSTVLWRPVKKIGFDNHPSPVSVLQVI